MKRCPICHRTYEEQDLRFCRVDGAPLIRGSLSARLISAISAISSSSPSSQGFQGQAETSETAPLKKTLRQPLALASVGPQSELRTEAFSSSPSIAVLPFVNLSEEKGNEYFGEGLAEELLNALGKIEHLKVAARTSAFSFRGKDLNIGDIGRAQMATVLEGSARKSGELRPGSDQSPVPAASVSNR